MKVKLYNYQDVTFTLDKTNANDNPLCWTFISKHVKNLENVRELWFTLSTKPFRGCKRAEVLVGRVYPMYRTSGETNFGYGLQPLDELTMRVLQDAGLETDTRPIEVIYKLYYSLREV